MATKTADTPATLRASAERLDRNAVQSRIALAMQEDDDLMAGWLREHQEDLARGAAALRAQAALVEYAEQRLASKPSGSLKLYALGMNDTLGDVLLIAQAELETTDPEGTS